ncbi:hypothetical protein J5Y09_09980 [Roseomonas sp. PWR1]|uniref:Uncharacterized protein n=1 Tax=Roseomonas nitratireducens TaxID=2820810 RepID=A0ABS4ASD3_9PROT|nr:hypothetical protein [Neoroseomonas nitratireducens]MBP0464241.1 hypothetical protein [Neoroseomonas nitratireducens]
MRAIQQSHEDTQDAGTIDVPPEAALAAAQYILGMVAGDLARAGFYASAQAVAALADLIPGGRRPH